MRIALWISLGAFALSLITGVSAVYFHSADAQAVCSARQSTNAEVRAFVREEIADPHVTADAKAQTTALVLKHFPVESC